MKKNVIKIMVYILSIITICISIFSIKIYATTINPNDYEPNGLTNELDSVTNKFGIIVDVLQTVGIIVTVVVLIILGIKYMTGSVGERAEYKKSMIPYLIGAVMIFALTQVLGIVMSISGNI